MRWLLKVRLNRAGMEILFILCGVILYFFPSLVAGGRNTKSSGGVFIINLFLGWTFVGWVVALAWAVAGERDARPLKSFQMGKYIVTVCDKCGMSVKPTQKFCGNCGKKQGQEAVNE